jgi:hypothetical protein
MAGDDANRLAATKVAIALQQCITDIMATLQAIEEKATEAHDRVRAIALLLKEE